MSVLPSSLQMTNLFNNPQLLGQMFPSINTQAIQAAFQAQQIVVEQPLTQLSQQLSSLSAPLQAWQAMQKDLQALQADAANLAGVSLYQGVSATSSQPAAVAVSAGGSGTPGTYQVAVTNLIQLEIDNSAGQASATTALGYSGSFSVNGVSVSVSSGDTLNDVAAAINGAGAGVTATVLDTGSGATPYVLNLASTEGKPITWSDPGGILQGLGVLTAAGAPANQVQAAKAAGYSINGVNLTSVTNTDSTSIPGVTLDFLAPTPAGSPAVVTVSQNTAAVQSAVQQFASDFNQYLSDSQKYTGKGGALEGDGTLGAIGAQLMQVLGSTVPGQPAALNDIGQAGLSLSAPVGSPDQFTLSLNASTLQSALQSNPAAFASLWNSPDGIATQVQDVLNAALGAQGGVTQAIQNLQGEQSDLQSQLSDPNSVVNQTVDVQLQALQAQFQTLMQALVSLSSQGSMISQFVNQLSGQSGSSGSTGSGG